MIDKDNYELLTKPYIYGIARHKIKDYYRKNYKVKDTVIVHTIEEMLDELKKYDSEDIFVIGGESIYRQLLPYCTKAYITKIDHAYDADTYFPNLDEDPEWEMTKISDEQTYFDLEYVFTIYERR